MTEATDEAEATPTEEPEGPKNTSFALGHKAKFCGFDVTLTYINPGKRRLTFTIDDPEVRLTPPSGNPVVGVVK